MPDNSLINRRIVLASRPNKAATISTAFASSPSPSKSCARASCCCARVWLSLDPYMRGRMSDAPSYAPPVAIGGVMTGRNRGARRALASSRTSARAIGCWRRAAGRSTQFHRARASSSCRRRSARPRTRSASSACRASPRSSDCSISASRGRGRPWWWRPPREPWARWSDRSRSSRAAASSVSPAAPTNAPGRVDAAGVRCLHRSPLRRTSTVKLAAACPGRHRRLLRERRRQGIPSRACRCSTRTRAFRVCGLISQYNEAAPPTPAESVAGLMRQILVKRLALRGFIISDGFEHRRPDFLDSMSGWLREGKIKYREDVVEGLENAPERLPGTSGGPQFRQAGGRDVSAGRVSARLRHRSALLRVAQMEEADRLDGGCGHLRQRSSCKTPARRSPARRCARWSARPSRRALRARQQRRRRFRRRERARRPPAGRCGVGLTGPVEALRGDALYHAARWKGPVEPLDARVLEGAGLVVDALFGAGLQPAVGDRRCERAPSGRASAALPSSPSTCRAA